jgi:ASC-1-like (ASCH) protein
MDNEKQSLLSDLRVALTKDRSWKRSLSVRNEKRFTLHLAIFREPYLTSIMEGKKTIETRFAKRRCAPYQRIAPGDIIVLKRASARIVGICMAKRVWFYRLDVKSFSLIKEIFSSAICPAEESFWDDCKKSAVATLILISNVAAVPDVQFKKRDRRGWFVFRECPVRADSLLAHRNNASAAIVAKRQL